MAVYIIIVGVVFHLLAFLFVSCMGTSLRHEMAHSWRERFGKNKAAKQEAAAAV
jgi:hypothetical protein